MSGNPGSHQGRASRIPEDVPQARAAPDASTDLRPGEDVTLELDAELIVWFEENEDDPGAAINAALREHMERRRSAI